MTDNLRYNLLYAYHGQVIGLLGGSFDPAHEGHVNLTREALKRFGLDQVWWLVTPSNPLKSHCPAPMAQRLAHAHEKMQHPRVKITDIEAKIGTRYTAATLQALMRFYPDVRFVWLMGADNLADFHSWDRWQWIMDNVAIGVISRLGNRVAARTSPAALTYRFARLKGRDARLLSQRSAPCWSLVNIPMVDVSSTQIRAGGKWQS